MKKKILSIFLAASMAATSLAVPASAADLGILEDQLLEEDLNLDEILSEEKFRVYTEADHGEVFITNATEEFTELEMVELLVIPEFGYRVDHVTATSTAGDVEVLPAEDDQYMFLMPAGDVYLSVSLIPEGDSVSEELEDDTQLNLDELLGELEIGNEEVPGYEETEVPDDFDFTIIDEENADLLQADTPEEEQLIEEIENGTMLAFAPIENLNAESGATVVVTSDSATTASASDFVIRNGPYWTMDEVWTNTTGTGSHLGTMHRTLRYTDSSGVQRTSPLYCLEAQKSGPLTAVEVKAEAHKAFSNSNIKKILYYGFGGPGDICDSYDPTCSHVDWSKEENRYVLTHYALSKTYSNDVGGATAAECSHIGLNKWITKLTSLALPNVKDLKFKGKNSNGDTASTKDMVGNLTYWRTVPDSLSWTGFTNGVQISNVYSLTSTLDSNGIRFTRSADDIWVMGYWTSQDDYTTRGTSNPRVLAAGKSVTLKKGAYVRFAFPRNIIASRKIDFTSILKPVDYILIKSEQQFGSSSYQDFGAFYYEGDPESLSLTFVPSPYGKIVLEKYADNDHDKLISGAGYQIRAAANIVSNGTTVFKKDAVVAEAYTNANGQITCSYLPVGKYYFIETDPKAGSEATKYEVDSTKINVSSEAKKTNTVTVYEIPKLTGRVSIRKVIKDTQLDLEGAQFTVYTWSKSANKYTNGVNLTYDAAARRYVSDTLKYTSDNQGKFRVKETKNPKGFTGSWSEDFVLKDLNQEEVFERTVENETSPRRVEITKLDSKTKENLTGAEFTIYPWNNINGTYESIGQLLRYDATDEKYYSEELEITDLNIGKFKIVESKNPDGYTGEWEKEINLNDADAELQYTVENTPVTPNPHGTIKIVKTDSDTGEKLEGAEFMIYQWNNSVGKYENTLGSKANVSYMARYEYYQSAELEINNQNSGKFKVVETKNPTGYTGTWEKEFVLTDQTPELTFEVTNDPDKPPLGEITVIKKIKEDDIIWAHGDPTFLFVVEGTDAKGIKHKYEDYVSFSQGGYVVDANGYASLQVTFKNVPIGQYQAYERPVLYYYLTDVIANTSNVSIVKGQTPKYGLNPKDIGYGNIQLTKENKTASITFVNTKERFDHFVHNDVIKNRIPITFE